MRRYQSIMLPAIITMLAMVFLASSVGATPPDWMMRQGSIGWALTQSDNTFVSVDCVVIDKIKAKQQPGYFVVRECFNYKDRVVVLTQPNQALRLGMNVDVSGTLITLPNGCRAIVSPTVLGYTDEDGVLLTRGGPFTKGLLQPTPWEWKIDLTVNEGAGAMSSMSSPQTISPNDDEPNATPAEGASYYATVAEILEAQSSATTTSNALTYDGIPEVRGLPDGSLVELQCKGITAVGTENIGGIDYNYFDMIENPPATDTIRCYYTGTAAVTDRVNRITGQIRHTSPETPVIDIDTGPDYDPQILEGSCQLATQGSIAWAKTFPDGTQLPAQLQAKVVSGSFGDLNYGHFFIQEPSRASGIRISPTDYYWWFYPGDQVTITSGQITTVNNQRAIVVDSEDIEWLDYGTVNPLGLNNKAVAGGPFNVYTPGATDAFGLNNVGLLIKTWGLASNVQPGYFYINDGSDDVGVKVDVDQGGYHIYHNVQTGDYAAVTGIAQLETVNDQKMRVVKPRDSYDIQVIATAPQFTNITVTPDKAGVDETVSISFYVSQTLAANPTVTVNGHSADYYSGGYNYYTYRYTVLADDPSGWATITISGRASGGLTGSAMKSDALWINDTTFDDRGNRRTMRDSRGVTYYEYDVLGRLTKVIEPDGKWVAYEYDLNNNRTRMTVRLSDDPLIEHVTQYQYNDRNLLWKVTDQLGGVTEYTYHPNGLVDEIRYPNGTKADHSYNERNWLTDLVNKRSDETVIASFHYEYAYDPANGKWGKNGTRTAVVEDIQTPNGTTPARFQSRTDYHYDVLYRLVREHRYGNGGDPGEAYDYEYAYDPAGNRLVKKSSGIVVATYEYDSSGANKLMIKAEDGITTNYSYDDAGNLLSAIGGGNTSSYTWDYRNLLTRYSETGKPTVDFLYDGNKNRVEMTANGITTRFLLDNSEVAEQITGQVVTSYVGPRGCLISVIDDTGRRIYCADGIGSTRAMIDSSESVAEAAIYDAYGNTVLIVGTSPSFGFAGAHRYYSDSTGMQHLKARYYDPSTGRFVSMDPARFGRNYYNYALNRPTMMVDPQGLFPGLTGCAIGAIGGGIGGIIGGGNWKEVACNAGLGCAAGGIAELLIEVFPVLGPSWAKCLLGAAAGGAGAAGGSGICNALFGDCPKEPFDWKCAAVSGLIGATTGCVGGFIDDDFWGVVLGVIGEAIGLDASSACSNDFPVPWFPKK